MTRKSGKKRLSFQDQVDSCFHVMTLVMAATAQRYGRDVVTAATTEVLIALLAAQDKSVRDTICAETCSLIEAGVKRLGNDVDIIVHMEPKTMQ